MAVVERTSSRLQIGRVAACTFQTIRTNLLPLSALSVVVAVPAAILRYQESILQDQNVLVNGSDLLALTTYAVGNSVLIAVISKAILPGRDGRYPGFTRCLSEVTRDFFHLAAIGIVSFAAVLLGIILLIVPGLIIGAIWAVVMPVRSVERAGLIGTFVRSAKLTSGSRWPIFGLLLALVMLTMAGEMVVNVVIGDPAFAGYDGQPRSSSVMAMTASTVAKVATSLIGAVGTAVVYFQLRDIKDGPRPELLAAEFD